MANKAFDKFINKESGSKKKEAIRQENKKLKAEFRAEQEARKKDFGKKNENKFGVVTAASKRKAAEAPAQEPPKKRTAPAKRSIESDNFKTGRADRSTSGKRLEINKKSNTEKRSEENEVPSQRKHIEKAGRPQTGKTVKSQSAGADNKSDDANGIMPLNKFIAHSGICGRREAAIMVKDGLVVVNGSKILEPGFKVSASDKITVKGKQLFLQRNLVYILLNKPKDYITTAKDPEGRKTVLELIKGATTERVYPVGRLDRNTTGVLLLTNDGELAQKLTHPSYEIKKIYEVKLDKPLVKKDFEAILNGITLEDGFIQADAVAYADSKDSSVIGIQIHSGRNRIVRRIFEHLGYDVKNLDRVMFANLTKKNVDRSKWRMLSEKEVRLLKYMNQSFVKKRDKKDD